MEKKNLIIVGTSVNAKHVYKLVTSYDMFNVIGFAVNREFKKNEEFLGLPVIELEDLDKKIDKENTLLFVALLWNRLNADRKKLYLELKSQGYKFANIVSPKASIRGEIIGDNCLIHDYVVIQNDAFIGNNVAIMAYSLIGDHCKIDDHCFIGAKATVGGGSKIGEQTFVGINCTVFDKTTVGKKCILGACTAVKRNVPDFSLYKTSSEIVIKQYSELEIEEKLVAKENVR